jgi:hypothetical protein
MGQSRMLKMLKTILEVSRKYTDGYARFDSAHLDDIQAMIAASEKGDRVKSAVALAACAKLVEYSRLTINCHVCGGSDNNHIVSCPVPLAESATAKATSNPTSLFRRTKQRTNAMIIRPYDGRTDKYEVVQGDDVIGHLRIAKTSGQWGFYPSYSWFNAEEMLFIAGTLAVCNSPDGIKKFL